MKPATQYSCHSISIGSVPASPMNTPSLNLLADSDEGGQYILDLALIDTSQTTASPSQSNEIFSFIIRIESDHSTSYIWQVLKIVFTCKYTSFITGRLRLTVVDLI